MAVFIFLLVFFCNLIEVLLNVMLNFASPRILNMFLQNFDSKCYYLADVNRTHNADTRDGRYFNGLMLTVNLNRAAVGSLRWEWLGRWSTETKGEAGWGGGVSAAVLSAFMHRWKHAVCQVWHSKLKMNDTAVSSWLHWISVLFAVRWLLRIWLANKNNDNYGDLLSAYMMGLSAASIQHWDRRSNARI